MSEGTSGDSAVLVASGAIAAATSFAISVLNKICLPAAEEFGLLLKDKISNRRALNYIDLMRRVENKLCENELPPGAHASPRLACKIINEASWIDDAYLQDMWAGLLSSSCTDDGLDDSNLLFTELLSGMTKLQARILNYGCKEANKYAPHGLIQVGNVVVTVEQLREIAEERDLARIDRELDHLRAIGILNPRLGGLHETLQSANLAPSPLGLHMYVRCQGSRLDPVDFFQVHLPAQ